MNSYQCHKVVKAAKITRIDISHDIIHLEGCQGYQKHRDWMSKHKPAVGGYLVEYEDGYMSYSPAQAFESGYTLIEATPDL